MDLASRVTESLDSFWFFSNVLSSTASETLVLFEPVTEEILKPVSETPSVAVVVVDEVGPAMSLENGGRGNDVKRGLRSKRKSRKILGEIDLGFDDIVRGTKFHYCGYCQKLGCLYDHYKNMPPLHDNIAMKEHLKSWAYAVACTVR
ncbi:hypothetical protein L484_005804 [Morus notabilis]|uniref:Uncharacterized protein n=1 Tax=Morus notabilis TaxID=981085 RepID=W9RDI8_9ROSA|nr:hypothetical protein L484_005804 [Morus notabilis]